MSGTTVRFKVAFGGQRRTAGTTPASGDAAEPAATGAPAAKAAPNPVTSRTARLLALAYHVERLVEESFLEDYAQAAKLLGLSRSRMTQVMDLRWLPPSTQEGILLGTLAVTERGLRKVVRSTGPFKEALKGSQTQTALEP